MIVLVKRKSILVLDDEFDIVNVIKLGLNKSNNLKVYGFTDPLLALEHFKLNAAEYGLVISDIRMPKMNGYEFVREVKKIKPKVKVFLMTAFDINSQEFSKVLPDIKVNQFIKKPISIGELTTSILNHINKN
ncbi:MAG: response regulator [Nitrososphaeraceae archaeon]